MFDSASFPPLYWSLTWLGHASASFSCSWWDRHQATTTIHIWELQKTGKVLWYSVPWECASPSPWAEHIPDWICMFLLIFSETLCLRMVSHANVSFQNLCAVICTNPSRDSTYEQRERSSAWSYSCNGGTRFCKLSTEWLSFACTWWRKTWSISEEVNQKATIRAYVLCIQLCKCI